MAMSDDRSYKRDPVRGCFLSSLVYVCTSYSQLVECRNGRLTTATDLPFSDGDVIKELESVARSTLFIVQSRRNTVAVVDVSKHQVLLLLLHLAVCHKTK